MKIPSPKFQIASALLIAFLTVPASTRAQSAGPTVTFDHLGGSSQSQAISAKPGQTITIVIENTCPDDFSYELGGIPLQTPGQPSLAGSACTPVSHTLTQVHDAKYGGYFVRLTRKDAASNVQANTSDGPKDLEELTFLVSVTTSEWDIGFAGGFTVSELTDPVFAAVDDDMMQSIVSRDAGAEDDVSLGLAGMIHLYHRKKPQWAATFGLSTGDSGEVSYMIGPSYRFSDKAAITLGYMWAPVDRLPSGLSIGDPLQDANALGNLQTKVDGGFFLGFSYSFISGIKDIFEKPFKGAGSSADGAASASASSSTANTPAAPPPAPTPTPPPGGGAGACTDNDDPNIDADGDGVPANADSDDCDPGVG